MSSFTAIKVVSLDESRLPRIRKEAYIDLFFKLSEPAPADWCEDFNVHGRQLNPGAKIDPASGDCIDTYVNDMEKIADHLAEIRQTVSECNERYREKLSQREADLAASNALLREQGGAQHRLNEIIDGLEFDS